MPSRHVDPQFTPLDADPSHAFVFAGAPADAQQWLTSGAPRSVLNPVALVNSLNSAAAGPRLLMIGPSLLSSELDFARPLVEAQRTIAASAARRRSAGRSREGLATVALQYGDFSGAAFQLEHAIALARKTGDDWSLATLLTGLGDVSRARGTYQRASELYAESEALHRRLGTEPAPTLRHNQAYVALHAGNLRDAHNLFNESLRLYQSYSEQRGMAECLVGLAGVAAATGDRSRAAMLLGAAEAGFDAVRAQISHPIGAISHAYPAS